MSLHQRSYQKELLDGDHIPFEDIRRNMQELAVINRVLGGHRITLKGIEAFTGKRKATEPLHVLEIGCGGGDNLQVMRAWAKRRNIPVTLTGVDINPECIAFAQSADESRTIRFICSDYRLVQLNPLPDVVFSSLFCHHFNDAEMVELLQWKEANSRLGFFINDLHRHRLAVQSIRLLTTLFSRSYLVKNDAPLSVKRGFVRQDWESLFRQAGIQNFVCAWQWAFRWLITCSKT